MVSLHEYLRTFVIISILTMKNVSAKCQDKNKLHSLYSTNLFPKIVPFMR